MGLFDGLFGGGGGGGGGDYKGGGSTSREVPVYTPEQEAILNKLMNDLVGPMGSGIGNLGNLLGGDQETFDKYFAPARRGFEQQTVPGITERFTGSFGEGSQNSSAFGQALGSAGRDLEEDIFSQRTGMQTDALNQLMNMMGMGMNPRTKSVTDTEGTYGGGGDGGGFLGGLGKAGAGAAGKWIGGLFG